MNSSEVQRSRSLGDMVGSWVASRNWSQDFIDPSRPLVPRNGSSLRANRNRGSKSAIFWKIGWRTVPKMAIHSGSVCHWRAR